MLRLPLVRRLVARASEQAWEDEGMAKIDAFFKLMFDQGASDLHVVSGQQPIIRLHGDMERVKYKVLEDSELKAMLYEIAPELKIKQYEETGDVDFGYEI